MPLSPTITRDREFTDGRLRQTLPSQRLVTAEYPAIWSPSEFARTPFVQLLEVLNPFLSATGYNEIHEQSASVTWEWEETNSNGSRYLLAKHLRCGQAYNTEIRDADSVTRICDELLSLYGNARYFSNCEIVWDDDQVADFYHVGDFLTDHTFEFGMLFVTPRSITLFFSWDED